MKRILMRRSVLIGLVSFFLTVSAAYAGVASAATPPATPSKSNNSPNAIKLAPLRQSLTLEPGKTATVNVTITNVNPTPVSMKVVLNDFVAGDEKGNPAILLDENSYAPTHSLKRFMKPVPNVTIAAGATQDVPITIAVPADAQAGGYYGAARLTPVAVGASGNLNLGASASSLILLTVPGNLVERLNITNFEIQQQGSSASSFRTPDNLELYVRFQNLGNVQVAPFGQINVTKGNKVVYKHDFNGNPDQRDQVLPDSARKWNIPLKNISKFGKYKVTANFTYGTKSEALQIEKTFWVIPTMYLIFGGIALLVLLFIIGLIVALIRAKRNNKLSSRRF